VTFDARELICVVPNKIYETEAQPAKRRAKYQAPFWRNSQKPILLPIKCVTCFPPFICNGYGLWDDGNKGKRKKSKGMVNPLLLFGF
jgi:hypothetical protein